MAAQGPQHRSERQSRRSGAARGQSLARAGGQGQPHSSRGPLDRVQGQGDVTLEVTRGGAAGKVTRAAAVSCTADGDPARFVNLTREAQIVLAEKAMSKSLFISTYPGFQSE